MVTLTIAAVLILLLTALMYAVESYDRMRKAARDLRRFEREQEREEARRQHYERLVEDWCDDLRFELDTYDAQGLLWLDERKRREE